MTFRQKSQEQSSVRIQTSVWSIASSFCLEFLLRRTLSLKFVLGHLMLWVGFREQSPSGGNKARCSSSMASAVCFRGHWGCRQASAESSSVSASSFIASLDAWRERSSQAGRLSSQQCYCPSSPSWEAMCGPSQSWDSLAHWGGTVPYQMGGPGDSPANSDLVIALCRLRQAGGNIHKECL